METPLELSFRNLQPSEFVEGLVRERVARLENIHNRITSCHVFVGAPHRRHRKGNQYEITIEVRVPGTELAVNRKPGDVNAHEEINVAIRDAFNAMERRLKHWKRRRGGDVRTHDGGLQGRIAEIDSDRGFGHIAATDGRLVYFHRNSVVGGEFAKLGPGDPVELVVQSDESEVGPQASTVRPLRETQFTG